MNNDAFKVILAALVLSSSAAYAGHGSREVEAIIGPHVHHHDHGHDHASGPDYQPVPVALVTQQVEGLLSRWNTPEMQQDLAESFRDGQRLMESMDVVVPRDATLRLLSVQGVQTLKQFKRPAENGEPARRVSIVSATVSTQLEYQSPSGFIRLPGVNEFVLEISEELAP
ncbi:hypothetical protein NCG89_11710 [Spongiibacter taiwanensis]|uniref:hypothetical protein n=1 Tax=Spongiibacter taiwanensis TaxID=1748242 RepID=UPI0020351430|nr:hypothetical protein [Spongiibacter taiwanensis]USA42187.1 hypothetical protein NCG89_11710 [Spongiibacter taiwanensis]